MKIQNIVDNTTLKSALVYCRVSTKNQAEEGYSLEAQEKLFAKIGREGYIKLPKAGTNPRGVEITKEALLNLVSSKDSRIIDIEWQKPEIEYHPYKRWVDYWREE